MEEPTSSSSAFQDFTVSSNNDNRVAAAVDVTVGAEARMEEGTSSREDSLVVFLRESFSERLFCSFAVVWRFIFAPF